MIQLISLLTGGFGIARSFPLITGLLLFSLVGMGWTYYQGRSGANERFEKAKIEAILKDTKENERLSETANELVKEAEEAAEKSDKMTEIDIEKIKTINPSQCLDIKLADIGLR